MTGAAGVDRFVHTPTSPHMGGSEVIPMKRKDDFGSAGGNGTGSCKLPIQFPDARLPARGRNEIRDPETTGLCIRGNRKRARWYFRFRWANRPARLSLGAWPEITVDRARSQARDAAACLDRGKDPRLEIAEPMTLRDLVQRYAHARRAFKSTEKSTRRFMAKARRLLDLQYSDLTEDDFISVMAAIEQRSAASAAMFLTHAKAVSRFARERKLGTLDLRDIQKPIVRDRRDMFTPVEIGTILAAAGTADWRFRAITLFQFATASRTSETRDLAWEDIDLEARTWHRQAAKTKTYRNSTLPLNDTAIEALELARRETRGRRVGVVFSQSARARWQDYARAKRSLKIALGMKPGRELRFHDVRRSFKHYPTGAGIRAHIGEIALSHATHDRKGSAATAYDTADYWDHLVDYMNAWNDVLDRARGMDRDGSKK